MDAHQLLADLTEQTKQHMNQVMQFQRLPDHVLNHKTDEKSWSILECIEHLNRYGDFYIPEIKKQITSSKHYPNTVFKTGILGNYFAKSMLPKEKLNKMKTFSSMNPVKSEVKKDVLDTFVYQQEQMLALLHDAHTVNLTKVKTAISISKWIKLRLGDTFRVVIYHNARHIEQAKRIKF